MIVLTGRPSGQAGFRMIWHSRKHFKPQRNVETVGLVWECSNRQKCLGVLQESNGLWSSTVGTTYVCTPTAQGHCMSWEVSCSWWSTLEVCVCRCLCWYFLASHCSGLSNTESGSTEIFSFFSGQLYSFGNFVYTKRNDIQGQNRQEVEYNPNQTQVNIQFFYLPPHEC